MTTQIVYLSGKGMLTRDEQLEIAIRMQGATIEEIFRATDWDVRTAVFQGGTSLGICWKSPRFSEDLDFLVAADIDVDDVARTMRRVVAKVEQRLALMIPGSRFELKEPQVEKVRNLIRCEIKWSHPGRKDKVSTRVEFYRVDKELLAQYGATYVSPNAGSICNGRIEVTTAIPVATPETLLADKCKALADRPFLKHRDLFDIWFISNVIGVRMEPPRFRQALVTCAAMYSYDLTEMRQKLAAYLESPVSRDEEKLSQDLDRWLPFDVYRQLVDQGAMAEMLATVRSVVEQTIQAIDLKPTNPGSGSGGAIPERMVSAPAI